MSQQQLSQQHIGQLRELQQSFMKHLLGTPSEVIEHIQSTTDASAKQRLGIYASGYRLRLKEAITSDFGCLHGYLGDAMFDHLMDCYIDKYQSQHPSLRYYSQHITELLTQQKPFADFPQLVEIANIEQAFNNSFDATDCTAIDIEYLGQIAVESWPTLKIQLHASVQLLSCNHNSFAIWKALTEENTPPALIKENSTWLIWRKDLISRYRALSDAETCALAHAMQGDNFSDLCEGLLEHFDEELTPVKAVTFLQTWVNEMMVCRI
jgi:hypothetical protein